MKILIFITAITMLFSCSYKQKYYKNYRSKKSFNSNITIAANYDNSSPIKYRVKPSESMAVGINHKEYDNNDFSSIRSENEDKINAKENNEDLEEITTSDGYIGQYKIGNPYLIENITYYPQEYDYYEETGTASWYGDEFHGKLTANGEIYNSQSLTAAHQTLPMPSMVKVINLDNKKKIIVRVNDRGPFAKNRIIDLSEKAAKELGFRDKGTANVKVEFLKDETEILLKSLNIKN